MNLSWCLPSPTRQEAPTGSGLFWRVLPFQLRDLAYLETWICEQAGHPLEGERVRLRRLRAEAGGDYWSYNEKSEEYLAFIGEYQYLRDDPDCWPPPLLSDMGQEILHSPAGRIEFMITLLSRTNPGWDRERLTPREVTLLCELDEEARLALEAIAYARHPGDEISRLMDPPQVEPFNWGEEIFKVIEFTGYTPEQVANLYMNEWTMIRSGGKYVPGSMHGSDSWLERVGARRAEALARVNGNGQH